MRRHALPKKRYQSRIDALNQPHVRGLGLKDPSSYHHLILSLKAKSPLAAMSAGIESLDLLRACWCIYANPSISIGSHERVPINTVRLGAFRTIHSANGSLAIDDPWYEPDFVSCRPFVPNSPNSDASFKKASLGSWCVLTLRRCLVTFTRESYLPCSCS